MSKSSYRMILRSSSIIGGAQVVTMLAGILKMKAVAVLLGPAGVGIVGLYLNFVQAASSVAAMGVGEVGTRQIAAANAKGGDIAVGRVRRALLWGSLLLSVLGALLFWSASSWLARVVLVDDTRADEVAWLALGVALTVLTISQRALLAGLRRVEDLARINVSAGVLGALIGVFAVWLWGMEGLLALVLVGPIVTVVLGCFFVARVGAPAGPLMSFPQMMAEWKVMAALGVAFMLSGLVVTLGHLGARSLVQRELGVEALGQFQAAWSIGITYLGFVLNAMGTIYYPRLTVVIHDPVAATRLANEQSEVGLLLCAPVLLAMLGFAPWIIHLLYSAEFGPAVDILRWQLLGDLLKVISFPLGFVILAAGAGKTFVLTESVGMAVFLLIIFLGLPVLGISATGIAYMTLYAVYLPLVFLIGRRRIGFRWSYVVMSQALLTFGAAIVVSLAARWSEPLGASLGLVFALILGLWALVRLSEKTEAGGMLGKIAALGGRLRNLRSQDHKH